MINYQTISKKSLSRKLLLFLIFQCICWVGLSAQTLNCYFDGVLDTLLENDPEIKQTVLTIDDRIREAIENDPQAIMNDLTYIIPVVFHVVHLGEPLDSGSNIPYSRLVDALNQLNSEFSQDSTGITFCPTQQDPSGNSTIDSTGENKTWVQRVDGSGISTYNSSLGLALGTNEVAVKALSNWPNTDYLNIWVVHEISGSQLSGATGFAYLPGTVGDDKDGIVIKADATGVGSQSKVLTHEVGHYLGLYHTFENDESTTCPPNGDCLVDGDRICDTRAHEEFGPLPFPCDISQYTCDAGYTGGFDVTKNHMNYTSESCRVQFTPEQIMRMRCVLSDFRSTLFSCGSSQCNSVVCISGCDSTTSSFFIIDTVNTFEEGTTLTFENTSSGSITFDRWRINGDVIPNPQFSDLVYTFNQTGKFNVCLEAYGPGGCVSRSCMEIRIFPGCEDSESCNLVLNGTFEQINSASAASTNFANVCGWESTNSSPFYCNEIDNNLIGLFFLEAADTLDEERITTEFPLDLETGETYSLSFDFYVAKQEVAELNIALTADKTPGSLMDISNKTPLVTIADPPIAVFDALNHNCQPSLGYSPFTSYTTYFTYTGDDNVYLNLSGRAKTNASDEPAFIFFDNIEVNGCIDPCAPFTDFTFDNEECPIFFEASYLNQEVELLWTFLCDGDTATGDTVSRSFPAGVPCQVCLTAICDQENSFTTCKIVEVPDEGCGEDCTDLTIVPQGCVGEGEQDGELITQVRLIVPKGTDKCGAQALQVTSNVGTIDVPSYTIKTSNPNHDTLILGLNIDVPGGYDPSVNPFSAALTLCGPEGEQVCYNFTVEGEVCDDCEPIELTSVADCIGIDSLDGKVVYTGRVIIPDSLISLEFVQCGFSSSDVDLEGILKLDTLLGVYVFDYEIIKSDSSILLAEILFCFESPDQRIKCLFLNIESDSCPPPDPNCSEEWAPKSLTCYKAEDGFEVFNFNMSLPVDPTEYYICQNGLTADIDGGGSVEIYSGFIDFANNKLVFNLDILMPCGYDTSQTYEMRLYLCDASGETVCWLFPFDFFCEEDCLPDSGNPVEGNAGNILNPVGDDISIYPNPTSDQLLLALQTEPDKFLNLRMFDYVGRIVAHEKITENLHRLDVSNLPNGLYFIQLTSAEGERIIVEKVVIAR